MSLESQGAGGAGGGQPPVVVGSLGAGGGGGGDGGGGGGTRGDGGNHWNCDLCGMEVSGNLNECDLCGGGAGGSGGPAVVASSRQDLTPLAACDKPPAGACDWCQKPDADLFCSRCRLVRYCNRKCQIHDWKEGGHKKACVQMCARCSEPFSHSTECLVPHPRRHREDQGSMFGQTITHNYSCNACGGAWAEIQDSRAAARAAVKGPVRVEGAQWCFRGAHTLHEVAKKDQRVVKQDSVDLTAGPTLQADIDALPRDARLLKRLTIHCAQFFDDTQSFTFAHSLSKLKVLHLVDVSMGTLQLTQSTVPRLRDLILQNVPGDCVLEVVLPSLKDVKIHYYDNFETGTEIINAMLEAATGLVSFDSYKLQVDGQLMFASNRLADVSIRRSDCLGGVSLWAPRLVNLSLQACYALESVELLADHPLKAGLPESHAVTTNIPVNLVNACVTPEVQSYLEAHPRVGTVAGLEGDDTDYSNGDPMFAMQSMFAQMHRGGNVFG